MNTIIFRYLNKEALIAMLAFTAVLLTVIVTGRVSKYLGLAAEGAVNANLLFWLVWYRLPEFLQLLLPLGLFLGILLGVGRLYVDHEMTVLFACGVSLKQLTLYLLGSVLTVTAVVAALSLWIAPHSSNKMNALWHTQDKGAMEFETLVPGRFQAQDKNTRIVYSENLSSDKKTLGNVFIAQKNKMASKNKNVSKEYDSEPLMIIVAESATQQVKVESGDRFLVLNNGYRYDGRPGKLDYRVMHFDAYGVRVADAQHDDAGARPVKTTGELLGSTNAEDIAELQWRISLPLLVPIIALLAVALSKVNPRQGRFVKLLPAFCAYLFYVLLLIGMRTALKTQSVPVWLGMWWVHGVFLAVAFFLFDPSAWKVRFDALQRSR